MDSVSDDSMSMSLSNSNPNLRSPHHPNDAQNLVDTLAVPRLTLRPGERGAVASTRGRSPLARKSFVRTAAGVEVVEVDMVPQVPQQGATGGGDGEGRRDGRRRERSGSGESRRGVGS
jgi:hypothetical protein